MESASSPIKHFESLQRIHFEDLDMLQIVHNARYFLLVERTIGEFWEHLGWGPRFEDVMKKPDIWHVVRSNSIEYLKPIRETGLVKVKLWVEHLGYSSLLFGFSIGSQDEREVFAKGTRSLVRIDAVSRSKTSWTEDFRLQVAAFMSEPRET